MIKINYEEKKYEIERVYKKWFKENCLDELIEHLKENKELRNIIFFSCKYNDDNILENLEKYSKDNRLIEEEIINFFISEPKVHFVLVDKFQNKNFEDKNKKIKTDKKEDSEIKKFFKSKYNHFRQKTAISIVNLLDIKVCPYCNVDYIDIYKDDKENLEKFVGQLDHYFDKDSYCYLAISLYNLIPCCQKCNHIKQSKKSQVFHPYLSDHKGLYKFKTYWDSDYDIAYLYGLSDKFNITIEANEYSKHDKALLEESKEVFRLDQKYKSRKIEIKNIIEKIHMYNDILLKEYEDQLFNDKNKFNIDDMKKVIFNNDFDEDKHNERLMSKLTYDILKEFDVK
ncbi:hypothetical protein [Paraclostridium sordellii]|uniref:hypothetical protein n=1 Tax=Paraclostridium sordellii TaxID=1505 RepID=UPI0005DFBAA5|nr:hypothetical protein [Paeniclostridium sordellii]CEO27915.1 HNH nuclease [[Clostridium] sordellii] [Paeniclostridium sordellii]